MSKIQFGILAIVGSAAEAQSIIGQLSGAVVVPVSTDVPSTTVATDAPIIDAGVDADGLAWSEDLHVSPPTKTDKGFWKVRKGKADADKAARAAFKASGAGVVNPTMTPAPVAPVAVPAAMPTAPAMTMPTMPTAPVAAPVFVPTYEQASTKLIGMVNGGVIGMETVGAIYAVCGVTDPNEFATDETKRLALWNELCKYQPVG